MALGDVYSQSLLAVVHKSIFGLLRNTPTDGTFDQDKQRERVRKATSDNSECFSFDISSCTDRFPAVVQAVTLEVLGLLTPRQSELWLKVCTDRDFFVPSKGRRPKFVRYSVGQPMGLLSSWSVMALTHHVLVAWAASRAG